VESEHSSRMKPDVFLHETQGKKKFAFLAKAAAG
jgi:hypothetical protein